MDDEEDVFSNPVDGEGGDEVADDNDISVGNMDDDDNNEEDIVDNHDIDGINDDGYNSGSNDGGNVNCDEQQLSKQPSNLPSTHHGHLA